MILINVVAMMHVREEIYAWLRLVIFYVSVRLYSTLVYVIQPLSCIRLPAYPFCTALHIMKPKWQLVLTHRSRYLP